MQVNEIAGRSASINDKGERTYTRVFQVITDSPTTGAMAVRLAAGIPRRGDIYVTSTEIDSGARVKRVDPQQDQDAPCRWEVRVEYDSKVEESEDHPLDRPAEYSWSFAQFTRVADKDIDGKALLNSAGQHFDPPAEVDDSRPVLTVTRNEASFNPSLAINFQDATNSDSFLGFSAGQVKVASISATSQVEQQEETEIHYWKVTYEFHFRREGWELSILDQGRYEKIGGKLVPIKEVDEDGNELESYVADPVPLNGAGRILDDPSPDNAKFQTFTVYKERPFAAFNL